MCILRVAIAGMMEAMHKVRASPGHLMLCIRTINGDLILLLMVRSLPISL